MIADVLQDPIERLQSLANDCFAPRPDIKLSDHICKTVRLSTKWEAGGGFYNLSQNPFLREIVDAQMDPDVRRITILKSTRVGGTLLFIASCLGISDLDPAPAMFVAPDEPSVAELRDRLYDTALESDHYRGRIPSERLWNMRHIDLATMRVLLAWAGSKQRLRGRTIRRLYRSEIDVYPELTAGKEKPLEASQQRIKRSFYSLILDESSPVGYDSKIMKAFLKGDQRSWMCPCPTCNLFQPLRFFPMGKGDLEGRGGIDGLKDGHGNLLPPHEVLETAFYRCLSGCKIDSSKKNGMVSNGVWVPKGCQVNSDSGKVVGKPELPKRHSSYHMWTIMIPTRTIGQIAESYVEAVHENDLSSWRQNELGLAPRRARSTPDWRAVGQRFESDYDRGTVPSDVWFLTAGIDVQLHGVYWTVWGWGDGSLASLIDWGYIRRYGEYSEEDEIDDLAEDDVATDLHQLSEYVVDRSFLVFEGRSPIDTGSHKCVMVCCDSNYRKNSVMRWLFVLKNPRIRAVRGDHFRDSDARTMKDRFAKTTIDRNRDGEKLPQTRELWNIASSHFKHDISDRCILKKDADTKARIRFPRQMPQLGQDFLKQFVNDQFVKKPQGGYHWKMPTPSIGRDYRHASAYAFCGAEMFLLDKGLNWDASNWAYASAQPEASEIIVREPY